MAYSARSQRAMTSQQTQDALHFGQRALDLAAQFGDNNDDFFNAFGQPQHDLDQAVLNAQIPANAQIQIQNPRGDVSISSGDGYPCVYGILGWQHSVPKM